MKAFIEVLRPAFAVLYCSIAIGGFYSLVLADGQVAASPLRWFGEGFAICLGGFLFAGFPQHFYLKKQHQTALRDYCIAGLGGGAIYGAVLGPIMVFTKTTVHYELLADPKHVIGLADALGSMFQFGLLGFVGGGLCASVFWSVAVVKQLTRINLALVMFLFIGFAPGLTTIILSL